MNKKYKDKSVITLADVARHAGVSPTAASFVLSNGPLANKVSAQKRALILKAAQTLAYVPNQVAQALRRQRTETVGIIFLDFYADWAQRVMQGLDSVLDSHGYVPLIARDSWNPQRQHREILSLVGRQVDGLILAAPMAENLPLLRSTQEKGTPVLFFGETPTQNHSFSYVVWNEGQAVKLAAEYLFSLGHRKIWFINPGTVVTEHLSQSRARVTAFEVFARKLKHCTGFMGRIIHVSSGVTIGEKIADMLTAEKEYPPDAILASNDLLGRQIMEALESRGITIPDQIALMGLCDHPISASPSINLSSVHQPLEEMAAAAGEAIVKMIAQPLTARLTLMFDARKLCIRGSTGGAGGSKGSRPHGDSRTIQSGCFSLRDYTGSGRDGKKFNNRS